MQNSEVNESNEPISEEKDGAQPQSAAEEQEETRDNKIDLFELANAAGQLVGNGESKPAALDDFFTKLKHLEHAWYEADMKYNVLKTANERLTNQLVHARAKCAIYQKKLRFIQDNQKNFAKLKEVYMTMKCEEGMVKSFVDLKDRSCQTVPLTVTVNPLTSTGETLPGCLVAVKQDSLVTIRRSEIGDAQNNLKVLKEMIVNREHSWALGKKIEEGLKSELKALQTQKATLEEIIVIKDSEIETLKSIQIRPSIKEELFDDLKRMIIKMDKRMKDLEKAGKIGRYIVIFTDKERQLLQDILENQPVQTLVTHSQEVAQKESRTKQIPKRHAGSSKSGPISAPKKVHPTSSTGAGRKPANVPHIPIKKTFFDEARELEALQKIRKEIEEKQSALREKVQQIIDYTGGNETPTVPTVT